MFPSRAEALAQIIDIVPEEFRDDVISLLTPAIGFSPSESPNSRSCVGGVPNVGPDFTWPRLELSDEEVAALPKDVPSLPGVTLDEGHSLCFIAQVDLTEAGALGDVAKELPKEGRLLFFWDQMVGCWADGPGATRVVWETTAAEEAAPAELPDDLRRKHDESGYEWSRFYAPARGATLYGSVMLPPIFEPVLEHRELQEELWSTMDDEVVEELSNTDGEFCEAQWCTVQLLGVPQPVQAEPREWFKYSSPEEWRLLFQFSLTDFDPDYGEGRIFFFIRPEDLAAHDFSGVRTVYQQT